MTYYYTDLRRGLSYRIIGFIGEDDMYETYHGRSSGHIKRDTVLHLLKNGNGRRYPSVKQVCGVTAKAQRPTKTRDDVILLWVGT